MKTKMTDGKSVQIIINSTFEANLVRILKKIGVTGYTQLNARGNGNSGVQDGQSDSETNVMFMILLSKKMADTLIDNLQVYRKKGHHILIYTYDAQVLDPELIGFEEA